MKTFWRTLLQYLAITVAGGLLLWIYQSLDSTCLAPVDGGSAPISCVNFEIGELILITLVWIVIGVIIGIPIAAVVSYLMTRADTSGNFATRRRLIQGVGVLIFILGALFTLMRFPLVLG